MQRGGVIECLDRVAGLADALDFEFVEQAPESYPGRGLVIYNQHAHRSALPPERHGERDPSARAGIDRERRGFTIERRQALPQAAEARALGPSVREPVAVVFDGDGELLSRPGRLDANGAAFDPRCDTILDRVLDERLNGRYRYRQIVKVRWTAPDYVSRLPRRRSSTPA